HLQYLPGSVSAKTYAQADGLPQNTVTAVYENRDGTLWSGTLSSGVSELRNGHFRNYTTADGLAANSVSSLVEGTHRTMWFGTSDGVRSLSKMGWRTYVVADGLASRDVNCLSLESAGALWIGTSEGLAFLDAGQIHVPRKVPDSLREQIYGIAEDNNGW